MSRGHQDAGKLKRNRRIDELHSKEMHPMTIVSIDTHRGAFRGRSNGGPGESVDQDPRIHEHKNMAPGQDDHARFTGPAIISDGRASSPRFKWLDRWD
jgi:hypothetical protein